MLVAMLALLAPVEQAPEGPLEWAISAPIARAHAVRTGKPILVIPSTNPTKFDQINQLLQSKELGTTASKFVCLHLNTQQALASITNVELNFSTTFFAVLDADGSLLSCLGGYASSKDFHEVLQRGLWARSQRSSVDQLSTTEAQLVRALGGSTAEPVGELSSEPGERDIQARTLLAIADRFRTQGKYGEAIAYLLRAADAFVDPAEKSRVYHRLVTSHYRVGNLAEARAAADAGARIPDLDRTNRRIMMDLRRQLKQISEQPTGHP